MAGINKIIIFPSMPIFNKDTIQPFKEFSKDDTCLLYSTLYLNHKDVLSKISGAYDIMYCFDETDKDYIPKDFNIDGVKKYFVNTGKIWQSIAGLLSKQFIKENTYILIIFSNTIGISCSGIKKLFNILNYDDNNILIGKTTDSKLSFIGMNYFPENLFDKIQSPTPIYEEMLRYVNKTGCFLHTLNGYLTVENMCNFRELYKILSKKESIEFCSQDIHERFTHLFIEYKELL